MVSLSMLGVTPPASASAACVGLSTTRAIRKADGGAARTLEAHSASIKQTSIMAFARFRYRRDMAGGAILFTRSQVRAIMRAFFVFLART